MSISEQLGCGFIVSSTSLAKVIESLDHVMAAVSARLPAVIFAVIVHNPAFAIIVNGYKRVMTISNGHT